MAYYTAGIIGSYFRGANTPAGFDISGSTVRATNLLMSSTGTFRDASRNVDISGGNIYISGTLIQGGGGSSSNIVVSGYIRNALTPTTLDISGGNISNSGTTRSSNFIGTSMASSSIGGIVMSNGRMQSDASDTFMVAAGSGTHTLAYSSNGSTWTGVGTSTFSTAGNDVIWSSGLWVAAGQGTNTLAYSSDGISWSAGSSVFSTAGTGIAWNGKMRWVATGSGTHTLAYSGNGVDWVGLGTSIFSTAAYDVAWNGSMWVAVGEGTNTIAYSTDPNGEVWSGIPASVFSTRGWSIAWNGTLWVAGGEGDNTLAYSYNGIDWFPVDTFNNPFTTAVYGLAWNGSLWVAAGEGSEILAISQDGTSWFGSSSTVFSGSARDVAWNGSLWVATGIGASHTLATSSDGANWTGIGKTTFGTSGLGIASRRFPLPAIAAASFDTSGGNVAYTGSIVSLNPATSNQIGKVTLRDGNVVVPGCIRDGAVLYNYDISGGNISNSGTTRSANAIVSGYLRNALTPSQFDISGGNISNSGTTRSANAIVSGYLRNALTATQFDISGGNISNSGRIINGPGTVSAPSYTFGADVSMGLYDPATNVLGVVTAGVERMRVTATGNVGIGTTAPSTVVDISGVGTGFVGLQIRNNAGQAGLQVTGQGLADTSGIQLYHTASHQGIYHSNINPFYIWTRGVRNFVIDQSGNTGIGMDTNPLSNYRMTLRGTGGTQGGVVFASSTNPIPFTGLVYDETNDTIGFRVNTGTADLNCNAMAITRTTARVGIGTVAPAFALDVCSSSATMQAIFRNSTNQASIYVTGNGWTDGSGLQFYHKSTDQGIYHNNSNPLLIWTRGQSRISIDQSGNINNNNLFYFSSNANLLANAAQALHFGGTTGSPVSGRILFGDGTGWQMRFAQRTGGVTTDLVTIDDRARVGIGVALPAYALDVSTAAGNAAINMTSWPRTPISNTLVRRFVATRVGNTLNLSNTGTTLDPNLITWDYSNASSGSSFRVLKSGIWNITAQLCANAGGAFGWIDACTNNASNTAIETAGSPWIAFGGNNSGAIFNITFVGYIPSNSSMFYKIRSTADLQTTAARASSYLHMTFLQEMPDAVTGFPNF